MKDDNLIPVGSLMKPFTAVGILRLIEQGKMGFNDTIASHVNQIFMSNNGTTIEKIFNDSGYISNVTIYELLHMKSGLDDYDDEALLQFYLSNPDKVRNVSD